MKEKRREEKRREEKRREEKRREEKREREEKRREGNTSTHQRLRSLGDGRAERDFAHQMHHLLQHPLITFVHIVYHLLLLAVLLAWLLPHLVIARAQQAIYGARIGDAVAQRFCEHDCKFGDAARRRGGG